VSLSRFVLVPLFLVAATPLVFAADVAGVVVDPLGQPLPRVYVRVVDSNGAQVGATFTDESGRFDLTVTPADCRIEATLTGFQPVAVSCSSGESARVVLPIAPIRESTIVTGTLTAAPLGQVGASATVVTAEDLERRQVPLMADLLQTTPGVMVVRSGAPGSLTSLFVRGGESDYNKVLLDGVPLNEPGGSFYFNNLTTENLDRVEVLRGAYSALFGSDAMASVIQLFTKRAGGRPSGYAAIDGGTYNTVHATAGVSGSAGSFDYGLGAARFASDNRVPNSRLENTTLSANSGVGIGRGATIHFVGRAELEHAGTPGTTAYGRPDRDAFFERHDGVASVSVDQALSERFTHRTAYSLAISHQQSTNLIADPPYLATFGGATALFASSDFRNDSRTRLRRHYLSYQADWRLSSNASKGDARLTLLVDWNGERAEQRNLLARTQTINARDNFGAAAQQQVLWRRVFLTVGARIERNENFVTAFVPRASAVFVVHEAAGAIGQTLVKTGIGAGIKEPTLLETYSVSPFFLGNTNLDPERSRSAELGVEQRFARDRARIELTFFHNRFDDIITVVTTDPATFFGEYRNVGVSRARGVEWRAEVRPIDAIHAHGSYTYLDSKILESADPGHALFGLGNEAFRRPRHSGSVGVAVAWQRATVDVNGVFVGEFLDSDFGLFDPPLVRNPGHTVWSTRLALKLTSRLTGTLMVDNLTNQDYSEPFGYQPLLRTIRAGVRASF
jgi:outer membrane cobalamin receptor